MAPADGNAYDSLGLSYQLAGDFEKSLAAFDKAMELYPEFEIVRLHRGITWMQMGRERDALDEFLRRARSAGKQRARYWQHLAWHYWRRGRLAEAQDALAQWRRLAPDAASWIPTDPSPVPAAALADGWGRRWHSYYLAERARAQNHPQEMLAHLRDALQQRPSWAMPEPLEDALADEYLATGKVDEAIAEYERALKLYPGMARARFHLAQAYRRAGRAAQAKEQYRLFLDLWKHADAGLPEIAEARAAQ
jgi:tetratricopeptide (TPR) repeat protein